MGNRERLVRAATGIFRRQGYADTSVEDLLEATGVARSNFYYHFDSKSALAREVVERWTGDFLEELDRRWNDGDATEEERVALLFRVLREERGAASPSGCAVGAVAVELAAHDPAARASLAAFVEGLERRLEAVRQDGNRHPEDVEPGPDARRDTVHFVGAMVLSHALSDPSPLDRAEREILLSVRHGTRPGRQLQGIGNGRGRVRASVLGPAVPIA